MGKYLLLVLLALLAAAGCSRKDEGSAPAAAPAAALAAREPGAGPARTLAYEHTLSLDVEEEGIAAAFAALQAVCNGAAADQCVILEAKLTTGRYPSAHLTFRARPAGIQKIMAAMTARGSVFSQSTTAEDLAAPLADAAKRLEMLRAYRSRLEALGTKAANDVDALIKVSKELAQVQSDIEAMAGNQAHLVRRVETEALHVDIAPIQNRSFWRPIAVALADFGGNLATGISSVVTGLAYLLPWSLCLLVFAWAGRKLWRRRRRPAASP